MKKANSVQQDNTNLAAVINTFESLGLESLIDEEELMIEEDTDEELEISELHCNTVRTFKAHLEYRKAWFSDSQKNTKVYAISDCGADATIVGKHAKVISYTNRYANIIGYDPSNSLSEKVPIVTALLKVRTNTPPRNVPIL